MNAPYAFAENAMSTQEFASSSDGTASPFISDDVVKRRTRRLLMERFEQASFVGVILTLIFFAGYIVLSEYSTPSALSDSGPMPVLVPEETEITNANVEVTWEDEPAFEVPVVPQMEAAEVYPIVGETVDTTWLDSDEVVAGLESSPYVEEAPVAEDVLESVAAPSAIATEVEISVGGVPMEAYLGQREEELVEEQPAPEIEKLAVESPAPVARREPVRIGVLRVGGGHPRDLKRLYTDSAVVYGLE